MSSETLYDASIEEASVFLPMAVVATQVINAVSHPKGWHHLEYGQRFTILTLRKTGMSIRGIAKVLGVAASTISRELRRLQKGVCSLIARYDPAEADLHAKEQRKNCGRHSVITEEVAEVVAYFMRTKRLSPEQIANGIFTEKQASTSSIYRGFESGILPEELKQFLWRKGKKRHGNKGHTKYEAGTSIHDRPEEINSRKEPGHWEADSVESPRTGSGVLFVLVERYSRMVLVRKSDEFSADAMTKFVLDKKKSLPEGAMLSITCDRGKEFANYEELQAAGIKVYFADPHSPNQKGSVENANGNIRRFFPKGTDFGKKTSQAIQKALEKINNWPRKILGWASAKKVFQEFIDSLK